MDALAQWSTEPTEETPMAVAAQAAAAAIGSIGACAEAPPADLPLANGSAGDAPEEVLTFKQHMWDRFEVLWQKRVVPTRRQLEALVICFRERAHLERQYARGMAQSVSKLQPLAEEGGIVPVALEAVICTMRNRSEQSAALADEIDQDVAGTIDAMLKQHTEVSRLVLADGQRIVKHWQEAAKSYEQSATRHAQAGLDAEKAASECTAAGPERPAIWRPLAERAVAGARRAAHMKSEYTQAVQRRNAAWELHERQMGKVFGVTQEMEEKRSLCFRDAAMKLAVYDTSWLRNVQYDLDSCVAEVEQRSVDADLQDFIKQNKTEAPQPPAQVSARPFKEHIQFASDVPKYTEAHKAVEAFAARTEKRVDTLRPLIRQLLTGVPGPPDASEATLAELRQQLASGTVVPGAQSAVASGYAPRSAAGVAQQAPAPEQATGSVVSGVDDAATVSEGGAMCRAAFCRALHLELLAMAPAETLLEDGTEVAEGQGPPPRKLPVSAVESFAELISAGLDGCDREGDAWNGRDLMVHAQALQADATSADSGGRSGDRPHSVLLKVYNHKLWSRVYFWEDVLVVGLAEAHVRQFRQSQRSGAEGEAPEALTTPFLRRYVSFMVALGIKQEQAIPALQQTLRKCAPFLGAPAAEAFFQAMTKGAGNGPSAARPT